MNLLESLFLILLCYSTSPVSCINRTVHIIQRIAGEHTTIGADTEDYEHKGNISPEWKTTG